MLIQQHRLRPLQSGFLHSLVRHKSKPIAAAGVRYSLMENWQIDGSVARSDGKLRWTGGIKYGF